MEKLELFQKKFENISCLKKLGFKYINTVFDVTDDKNRSKYCKKK